MAMDADFAPALAIMDGHKLEGTGVVASSS
jgi:hypothetical protein